MRGGGGNFGVVTSFLFRLHEVGTVIAGPTFWPVEHGAEVLAAYREFLPDAPRELNGFFAFHTVPPAPPFPEELHLRKVCGVVWCYVGDEADAAKAMAPLLDALPEPLHARRRRRCRTRRCRARSTASTRRATSGTGAPTSSTRSPTRRSTIHARFGAELPTMKSTMHLYPIDGAAHDVGSADTAWSYRDAKLGRRSSPASTPTRPTSTAIRTWSVDYWEALHPYSAGGAYVNMMMDEGQERVRASYRDNYDRLARDQGDVRPGQPLPRQPEHPACLINKP